MGFPDSPPKKNQRFFFVKYICLSQQIEFPKQIIKFLTLRVSPPAFRELLVESGAFRMFWRCVGDALARCW